MILAPVAIPTNMRWLDDAAREVAAAWGRFNAVAHGFRVTAEPDRRGTGLAWCFYAVLALSVCKPTNEQLQDALAWAQRCARERHEGPANGGNVRPFSALAEEAERIARAQ